ncbi:MAG: IS66 family transposase [Acidimicrobiales bacterium]
MVVGAQSEHDRGRGRLVAGLERWRGKARSLAVDNKRLVAELGAVQARVVDLEGQLSAAAERIATLSKLCFGTSSEKKRKNEPEGAGGDAPEAPMVPGRSPDDGRRRRGQQPGSAGHGRRDYSVLETEEVVHDLFEHERCCPDCGEAYEAFGEETSTQVDWQVRIVRVLHRRRRYTKTCRCKGKGVVVAPVPPKPIRKGLFSSQFLARLIFEKYVLGRPLERIVAALRAEGLEIAKGSLVGALRAVSCLLEPLDEAIRARNAAAYHLHIDETSWQVFEEVEGKANHRWWLWVFVSVDTICFDIDPTRSSSVLERHLGIDFSAKSLPPGRSLLVSSDFYTVYQSLAMLDGVEVLWCFSHIRRYFIRAGDAHEVLRPWRDAWVERFAALYRAHHALRQSGPGSPEHATAAEDFALALGEIDVVRQKEAAAAELHPAARKVLATLEHEWAGLVRHASYPEADLDNNRAERAIRGPVVGRKNYYGSGSIWAATLAARAWTITATASRAGLNPLSYLHAYLEACATSGAKAPSGEALARFFPWAVSKADLAAWSNLASGPAP